jgi:hypothetical protein
MALWACGHHRLTFNSSLQWASDELLSAWSRQYPDKPGRWGEQVANEIRRRRSRCPACEGQHRANVRHWSALALLVVLALLVACAASTASCSATASSCCGGCP